MKKEQFHFKRMLAGGLAAFTLANFPAAAHATDFSESNLSETSDRVSEQTVTADMDLSDLFVEGDLDYTKEDADAIASLENSIEKMEDANAEIIYALGTNGIHPDFAAENYISYDCLDEFPIDRVLLTPSSQMVSISDEDYSACLSASFYRTGKWDSLYLTIGDMTQDYLFIGVDRLYDDGDYISFRNGNGNAVSISISSADTEQYVTSLKEAFLQKLDEKKLLEMPAFDSLKENSDYCEFVSTYSENTETKENSKNDRNAKQYSKTANTLMPF